MDYLDFEKPIEELVEKLNQAKHIGKEGDIDVSKTVSELEKKIKSIRKKIYENLTPWQKVQMSRHPQRPYTMDYINALTKGDFIEIHSSVIMSPAFKSKAA